MNVARFLEHWHIADNPFRGEEALHDGVLARVALANDAPGANAHSEFEKIIGELGCPSTSIVFGEKGSGKTAIRLQIAARVRAHNAAHPDARVLLVPYDDLDPVLARVHEAGGGDDPSETLAAMQVTDHADAVLARAVTPVVSELLGESADPAVLAGGVLGDRPAARATKLTPRQRADMVLLAALYDTEDEDGSRVRRLRKLLRVPAPRDRLIRSALLLLGWIPAAVIAAILLVQGPFSGWMLNVLLIVLGVAAVGYLGVILERVVLHRYNIERQGTRLRRRLRSVGRTARAHTASLAELDPERRAVTRQPVISGDDVRSDLTARLLGFLRPLGCTGMLVVLDRVDEPTLVSGDADRMRSVVWPMLSAKFLQQDGVGFKMLLPIELRHALFKESSAFFQEARLDKQSMVERLTWTGPMLYDLAGVRLAACRDEGAEPITLTDLFEEDVTRQDIIDALDQMRQPRDALKFLYRCIAEHCSNVTAEQNAWRIPRLVLESIRRQEADRVQALQRGIRPA